MGCDTGWLNISKLHRRNAEGRARRILPFVAFYPALLEVEANQNHINVRVFSEHSQPHWAWGCGSAGGVFLFTAPHMASPHAFVSGPSFWVAAATGTSWNTPLVLNLTTGGFVCFPTFIDIQIW